MPRGRPARITRAQIVAAARDVGVEELRMSDVARALDVAPAALYHHVRDRDELLGLVAAEVLEETAYDQWVPSDDAPWEHWVRAYAVAFRTAVIENSTLFRYVRLTTLATATRLEQIDRLVAVLLEAGFALDDVSHAIQFVNLLVVGEAWEHSLGEVDPQAAEFDRAVAARATELPHLTPLAGPHARPDPDSHFEFALDCLIAGMRSRL